MEWRTRKVQMAARSKKCFKCGVVRPLTEFYAHPRMGDGLLGKCKDCTRRDAAITRNKHLPSESWRAREASRQREKQKRRRILYPEQNAAQNATRCLPKFKGFRYHHWSYEKEHFCNIFFITAEDHRKIHTYMRYRHDKKCFETLGGKLLDSRIKASGFYNSILGRGYLGKRP